jgi:hypothetical protein
MNRESDEDCLALIATIRKRGGTPDGGIVAWWREYERLLDNLEVRIRERQLEAAHAEAGWGSGMPAQQREAMEARNARESAAVDRLVFDRSPNTASLTEDCPCGTETCREAWRELREAAASAKAEEAPSITCPKCGKTSYSPSDIKARYCGACHLFHDQWVLDVCGKQQEADAAQGAIRFRDVIREEVAAEVARQVVKLRQVVAGAVEDMRRAFYASLEAKPEWTTFQRGEDTPEARAWIDGQQSKLDKLRAALEAKAS